MALSNARSSESGVPGDIAWCADPKASTRLLRGGAEGELDPAASRSADRFGRALLFVPAGLFCLLVAFGVWMLKEVSGVL